jgi:hypothetical protein
MPFSFLFPIRRVALTAALLVGLNGPLPAVVPGGPPDPGAASPDERARVSLDDLLRLGHLAPTLIPKPAMEIPNPPYSLRGLAESRKMSPEMVSQWRTWLDRRMDLKELEAWRSSLLHPSQETLPVHRYAIFHGFGTDSLRRLLDSYYTHPETLNSQEVFALSPWVVLALRNVVSGTLIDVTKPVTWYQIGFLVDVPLECLWKMDRVDAYVPMESRQGSNYVQARFRELFRFKNPFTTEDEAVVDRAEDEYAASAELGHLSLTRRNLRLMNFRKDYLAKHFPGTTAYGPPDHESLLPPDLLLGEQGVAKGNEAAFFTRITDPDRQVGLTAVVLTGRGNDTGVPPDLADQPFYEDQARLLAQRLGLPFYDLRLKPPPATSFESKDAPPAVPAIALRIQGDASDLPSLETRTLKAEWVGASHPLAVKWTLPEGFIMEDLGGGSIRLKAPAVSARTLFSVQVAEDSTSSSSTGPVTAKLAFHVVPKDHP